MSWDLSLGESSWDSDLGETSPVVVYGMRRAFVRSVSWDLNLGKGSSAGELTEGRCRNSQHCKNCVSLSSCRKTKSQKVNKRFIPELKKVVSVSGFLCMWTFYVSVYMYMYIMYMYITTITPQVIPIYIYIYTYVHVCVCAWPNFMYKYKSLISQSINQPACFILHICVN